MSASNPPPDGLWIGIQQFNQGDYYACHDTLEAIWMVADDAEKPFYQGILQIAVALYHLRNQNWRGATILLGEGLNRLRGFEPAYYGVDVSHLMDIGFIWLERLQVLGPEQVETMARAIAQAQIDPNSNLAEGIQLPELITPLPTPHISQL